MAVRAGSKCLMRDASEARRYSRYAESAVDSHEAHALSSLHWKGSPM